jgi:hypothetical protein
MCEREKERERERKRERERERKRERKYVLTNFRICIQMRGTFCIAGPLPSSFEPK